MTEAPRDIKILVATPVGGGEVKRGYAYSMARAMSFFAGMQYEGNKAIDLSMVWSCNLPENRHRLVSQAFQLEATHILFWDSDIKAPPDCIVRLLNHGAPIVAVNYPTKELESRPTAYIDSDSYTGPAWTQEHHTGLMEVTVCGFGLMLIDMRVFEEIDLPFFQMEPVPPDFIKTSTEDVWFCRKVREKNIPIVIDQDLSKQIAHIGDWEYSNQLADMAQKTKQQIYRQMDTKSPEVPG